ncbi:hypothetical protein BJB45_16350 [Halomonas huangheensis]|uniref:Uncharacterized protein n=1 Tax=Halomonas huangheensis TaxID=1178482 RepID=W1NBE7_9GAMM|nr:hypothetical protein BJB45_16350 [Halomonas huangheensis]
MKTDERYRAGMRRFQAQFKASYYSLSKAASPTPDYVIPSLSKET